MQPVKPTTRHSNQHLYSHLSVYSWQFACVWLNVLDKLPEVSYRKLGRFQQMTGGTLSLLTSDATASRLGSLCVCVHACVCVCMCVHVCAATPTAGKRSMQPPPAGSWPPAATVWEWEAAGCVCVCVSCVFRVSFGGRVDRKMEGMSE